MNIAVFASHEGSDLQAIIDACNMGVIQARVCCVISNNNNSRALIRAKEQGIPSYYLSLNVIENQKELDEEILRVLIENKADIIFLAGYLRKLGHNVIDYYINKIYNIHPSLLPKYGGKGMYGIHVHSAVIESKENETGITIHRVNGEYDDGEIIAQTKVPVYPSDTPEILAKRVLSKEHVFIVTVLKKIVNAHDIHDV